MDCLYTKPINALPYIYILFRINMTQNNVLDTAELRLYRRTISPYILKDISKIIYTYCPRFCPFSRIIIITINERSFGMDW